MITTTTPTRPTGALSDLTDDQLGDVGVAMLRALEHKLRAFGVVDSERIRVLAKYPIATMLCKLHRLDRQRRPCTPVIDLADYRRRLRTSPQGGGAA